MPSQQPRRYQWWWGSLKKCVPPHPQIADDRSTASDLSGCPRLRHSRKVSRVFEPPSLLLWWKRSGKASAAAWALLSAALFNGVLIDLFEIRKLPGEPKLNKCEQIWTSWADKNSELSFKVQAWEVFGRVVDKYSSWSASKMQATRSQPEV